MISKIDIEFRVNKMAPDQNAQLKSELYKLQRQSLPFHPLILVFSTGPISADDCVPMAREPVPSVGSPFSERLTLVIEDAVRLNPSIHDGAIIFSRDLKRDEYRLSAWSMRITSTNVPDHVEPNVGSAHNSALALSLSSSIDLCAIISSSGLVLFENGLTSRVAANHP